MVFTRLFLWIPTIWGFFYLSLELWNFGTFMFIFFFDAFFCSFQLQFMCIFSVCNTFVSTYPFFMYIWLVPKFQVLLTQNFFKRFLHASFSGYQHLGSFLVKPGTLELWTFMFIFFFDFFFCSFLLMSTQSFLFVNILFIQLYFSRN